MVRSLHILLIDDDANLLEVLRTYLTDEGHFVVARGRAEEGLAALRDQTFDLVLTDGRMAGMDGFEFTRIARRNYPDLAIILMTAHEGEFPISEALVAGADGYITKPFSLRKLALLFQEDYWTALSRQDWWAVRSMDAET